METKVQAITPVEEHKLSMETCVKAINNCLVLGRKALQTELAVCLAMFAGFKSTKKEARDMVMGIYQRAGYKCEDSKGLHYKTVNRRLNASAGLFDKIGSDTIAGWVGKANEEKMISAIEKGLVGYQFDTMDDVREFIGLDNNRKRETKAKKVKKEKPQVPMYKFSVGRVRVEIPQETSAVDLIKLASRILEAGRKKEQEELKASIAHPSTAPSVSAGVPALH